MKRGTQHWPYAARLEFPEYLNRLLSWTGYSQERVLSLFGIRRSTYFGWFDDSGNLRPPKDRKSLNSKTALPHEIEAVIRYRHRHRDVGYRKLTWMMVDEGVAFLPESTVYDILSAHGLLYRWDRSNADPAEPEYRHKPKTVHEHWHTDIAYIKIQGIFYFLIMMLDGYSRFLLGWELMSDMRGASVEDFILRVREKYPHARPRLIHDNGAQFISRDFKKLITRLEIQDVRTRRNHPQTNGKMERMNGTVKAEAIRPNSPQSYKEACEVLNEYEWFYNYQRLHAGIGYLRPSDLFFGRAEKIQKERKQKIQIARKNRVFTNKLAQVR